MSILLPVKRSAPVLQTLDGTIFSVYLSMTFYGNGLMGCVLKSSLIPQVT
ncbi:hypothetical protein CTKA_02294 [Chthonomonas calidirosea]|uniref:Uncharacterized protein n=1 Tax=Chthonomonas calidirosea (strain DSM 23976 / ICMP 18418 / T49) TaxID=1303518 RepID=S0EV40_CHTCT|nr:hypothetical protein CCALI_01800 [Chthonomonas calidirosea T49]CEK18754.1 hypothetical protein CP488_02292 [Chthonomonas calidirosea]CEK19749.1 hypothetical protein CTKA_02294 [Chthonomonas calidirosea]